MHQTWQCPTCTLINIGTIRCSACDTRKNVEEGNVAVSAVQQQILNAVTQEDSPDWTCSMCTVINSGIRARCLVCRAPKNVEEREGEVKVDDVEVENIEMEDDEILEVFNTLEEEIVQQSEDYDREVKVGEVKENEEDGDEDDLFAMALTLSLVEEEGNILEEEIVQQSDYDAEVTVGEVKEHAEDGDEDDLHAMALTLSLVEEEVPG